MTDLDQLLAGTFDDLAAHAPHDPGLAARVRGRARRTWYAGGAAVGALAVATAAVVIVASSPDAGNTAAPTSSPAPCDSTVVTGVLPVWARGGFSDPKPVMPYVTSASGDIVAIIWEPLTGPPKDSNGDKVLWAWRDPQVDGVRAVARLDGTGPPVSFVDPGVTGPSSVSLPSPGCWRVAITWPGGSDTIDLAAARP